jgi:RecA/RadA recombinase
VLGQTLKRLLKLAETYNVAILITNQVMADPSGQGNTYDPKKVLLV